MPSVCVLMSVCNAEKTLGRSVKSLLNQDFTDFEILLIDDGSIDGTRAMIQTYATRDSRIRLIAHDENCGLTQRLNEGLQMTDCEFIARMDADDESLPGRLRIQFDFLMANPQVDIVGSFVSLMGVKPACDELMKFPVTDGEIKRMLPEKNCLFHPAIMMRRKALVEAGGYREIFKAAQDYDLWLRMSGRGKRFYNIPEPLLRYSFSIDGVTLGRKWDQLYYTYLAQVCYEHPEFDLKSAERKATERLDACDRKFFFQSVTQGTCEELIRLGYKIRPLVLLGGLSKEMGFIRTLKTAGSLFVKQTWRQNGLAQSFNR